MLCNIFTLHNYFHITPSFHNHKSVQWQSFHVYENSNKANEFFSKSLGERRTVLPLSLLHHITFLWLTDDLLVVMQHLEIERGIPDYHRSPEGSILTSTSKGRKRLERDFKEKRCRGKKQRTEEKRT